MNEKKGVFTAAWIVSTVGLVFYVVYLVTRLFFGDISGQLAMQGVSVPDPETTNIIIGIVFILFLIPLAWAIPMTVHMKKIADGKKSNSVAFSICTLLFCSLISGILLLIGGTKQ